jgi:eukaryotic-like serine/threonine-protein kinase
MKHCPVCKKDLKDHLLYCPFDGQLLVAKTERDEFLGLIIENKYQIEEKIGEGGMGKVYRATHIQIGHTVAVKILHSQLASDQTAIERFRREARAAAYIQHPNAVAVTDFGVMKDTGMAYLVMEFLTGIELRQMIKERKQLGYEETFIIVHQTCSALQAAHIKGIIHRDLKPDNIWLVKSDDDIPRVKVLDFGIAKLKTDTESNQLTQQGMIVGTPYYMSPEQCRSEELDARSDIYSLGIILYEMLTGQVPFLAATPVGVVLKHANEAPRPLRELRDSIPEPLEAVVLRALKKERKDRQDSASQLAQEFENALYQAGIELKVLGTNTPQSIFPSSSMPYTSWKSISPDRSRSQSSGTPPPALAPVVAAPENKGTTKDLFQTTVPGNSLIERLLSTFTGPREDDRIGQRKLLFIGLAAALAVVLIVGIIWFATSGGSETEQATGDQTQTPPGNSNGKPAVPIPEGMVLIPDGKFIMGYNGSDEASEKPEHERTVESFFIDKNEVTVGDYYRFIKTKNLAAPKNWPRNWAEGKFSPEEARLPVSNISWFDAKEYAESIGKRLPTEVEWEYAARGKDKRLYPWGNDFNPNYANVKDSGKNGPVPVGSYSTKTSPFGVMDMAGNVAEWTGSDSFRYPDSKATPKPGKIVRGGSFINSKPVYIMVTTRVVIQPNETLPDLGFRCAKDAR